MGTGRRLCHLLTAAARLPHSRPNIPCQRSQWGPWASAETLTNSSGMQSWSCSMCWRRRHDPPSLPPTLHHQHGFMALQEQDPRLLTSSWPKAVAGAFCPSEILAIARSVCGREQPPLVYPLPWRTGAVSTGQGCTHSLAVCHCGAKGGCQQILPKSFPRPG